MLTLITQNALLSTSIAAIFLAVVFLLAQHNKNNVKLEPEEVEKLLHRLNDPELQKDERNVILKKLKPHLKATKLRKSRQNREDKKRKKK